jgi:hypothetical protein
MIFSIKHGGVHHGFFGVSLLRHGMFHGNSPVFSPSQNSDFIIKTRKTPRGFVGNDLGFYLGFGHLGIQSNDKSKNMILDQKP